MLKKIKLNNSTILLMGIIFVVVGACIGFYEIFSERRNKIFSDMNILLYENEKPSNIESDEEIEIEEKIENEMVEQPVEEVKEETKYDFIGILEIPKINLKRGFLGLDSKYNKVDYNITLIKGSTFPDETNNNLILAAHSGNCKVCFFDKLFELSINDNAYVQYNNERYKYILVNTYEVEKDGTVPIYRDYDKNVLTLITCTKYSDTTQTVFVFELDR